jgi:hypothetical protein
MSISNRLYALLESLLSGVSSIAVTFASGATIPGAPEAMRANSAATDQRLTVSNAVVQLSVLNAFTTQIFWTSEDAEIRVTFDGSNPTTTNGHIIAIGSSGIWSATLAGQAKFIRTGSTDGAIHATEMIA